MYAVLVTGGKQYRVMKGETLRVELLDAEAGKALQGDLIRLRSLRVGRFRVIYRAPARRIIEIVSIGPRDRIYEETLRLVSAERKR